MTEIYVGNLDYNDCTEEQLRNLFERFGNILKVNIPVQDEHPRGFAFISFADTGAAKKAITAMNGLTVGNRQLRVNEATKRSPKQTKDNRQKPSGQRPDKRINEGRQNNQRFYNPYTFVPTPPRNEIAEDCFAGDADPLALGLVHDRLQSELWTGTLEILAETITPLILPAPNPQTVRNEHKIYECKSLPDPSELRGMLRSAYETVTNSRYHGFDKDQHCKPLGLRSQVNNAIRLIPARVVTNTSTERLELELLPGMSEIDAIKGPKKPDKKQEPIMYAAWLHRYKKYNHHTEDHSKDKHEKEEALYLPGKRLPQHGQRVYFSCTKKLHERSKKFQYLQVTEILDIDSVSSKPVGYEEGFVCITGRNMVNKHWERIFFNNGPSQNSTLHQTVIDAYALLVLDYRKQHKDERERSEMNDYLGHEPGKTGFSRHIWADDTEKLEKGELVFAEIEPVEGGGWNTKKIFPVMISRDLYDLAPGEFLDESLKHAQQRNQLSPADRLFGWVASGKSVANKAAYRGRLRIEGPPSHTDSVASRTDKMQSFTHDPVTLAILGEPKPAQGRFYLAKNAIGTKQDDGGNKKNKGYNNPKDGKALRGRKVFWHHREREGADNQWWRPGKNREYFSAEQGKQNRSIKAWIKPETTFSFKVHITNATEEEIGALLWLLSFPDGHFFRLGYGKPFGFGSIRLQLGKINVVQGKDWREWYKNIFATVPSGPDKADQKKAIDCFQEAMILAYEHLTNRNDNKNEDPSSPFAKLQALRGNSSNPFTDLPFIASFLAAARGPSDTHPIHYPRLSNATGDGNKIFEWFSNNDNQKGGRGLCLPDSTDSDGSLPCNPLKDS